jgi:hypothetical protein
VPRCPIATPMSAALSAGASLTPSPVMETTCPSARSAPTRRSLCSGLALAKMSVSRASAAGQPGFQRQGHQRAFGGIPLQMPAAVLLVKRGVVAQQGGASQFQHSGQIGRQGLGAFPDETAMRAVAGPADLDFVLGRGDGLHGHFIAGQGAGRCPAVRWNDPPEGRARQALRQPYRVYRGLSHSLALLLEWPKSCSPIGVQPLRGSGIGAVYYQPGS